jgi:uncharacterized membrane protein YedE/YeeE
MADLYRLVFVDSWAWWVGGVIIGALVPLMYYFTNTALGVSTGYGSIVKKIVPGSKLRWLNTKAVTTRPDWRLYFIVGMIGGAFVSARLSGMPWVTQSMGIFTSSVNWGFATLAFWFLCGGFLLGIGARIAGGCTSGHSIHGLSNLHMSSVVATAFFLFCGYLSTRFITLVFFK